MAKKASSGKTKAGSKTKAVKKAATGKSVKKASTKTAMKSKPSKKPAGKGEKAAKKPETKAFAGKKVKTTLTKDELKMFREMLINKRRSLIGDMGGIEAEALRRNRQEAAGDLSSMPTHPADLGTDNYELEFSLGLLESERSLLHEINEALDRIDDNTYGICLGTGKPISKARLMARPWAKFCIEYARMVEKGMAHPEGEQEEDYEPEESFDDETESDSEGESEDYSYDDFEE